MFELQLRHGHHLASLRADRTIYLPQFEALLLSDLHLGKCSTFRQAGIYVPGGVVETTLQRWATALDRQPVSDCYILGDLIHSVDSLSSSVAPIICRWMEERASTTRFHLLRGNHDCASHDDLLRLPLSGVETSIDLGEFRLQHYPIDAAEAASGTGPLLVCGHLHPGYRLPKHFGRRVHVPCFVIESHQWILPAFGEFTGFADAAPRANGGGQLIAICENELIALGQPCNT